MLLAVDGGLWLWSTAYCNCTVQWYWGDTYYNNISPVLQVTWRVRHFSPPNSRPNLGPRGIWVGGAEIIPVKDSHAHPNKTVGFSQRPRPLHNGYTRTDTCFRWGMAVTVTYSRYKLVTVSLLKRFRNGRFNSETAARRFQKWNFHLDPEAF